MCFSDGFGYCSQQPFQIKLEENQQQRTVGELCVAKPEIILIFSSWKVSLSQNSIACVFLIENREQLMRLL